MKPSIKLDMRCFRMPKKVVWDEDFLSHSMCMMIHCSK
jgi:hypothetical protein